MVGRLIIIMLAGVFLVLAQLPPVVRAGLLEQALAWSAPHLGAKITVALQGLWVALLRSLPDVGSWLPVDITVDLFFGVWMAQCLMIHLLLLVPLYLTLPPVPPLSRVGQGGAVLAVAGALVGIFEFARGGFLMPFAGAILILVADRSRRLYLIPRNLR